MSFSKLTIRDVPLENQIILVRVDYNVPLSKDGKIGDDLRIRASLPTLQYLRDRGCKIVIISHLGRPEGKDQSLSLEPIAEQLAELLNHPVTFVDDCVGDKVVQAVRKSPPHSVILLENLRFYKEEEADDDGFARKIVTATGARYFVQDGFGVVHRSHASTHAVTLYVPSVAGLLLEKEYETITSAMKDPERPLVAVMGGAKVSDKIGIIEKFIQVADKILIGGAMANTFLANAGVDMGASRLEKNQGAEIQKIYDLARTKVGAQDVDKFIILPIDVAVGKDTSGNSPRKSIPLADIQPDELALDIGDRSIEMFITALEGAGTVVWNGTLGYAELPEYSHGSARVALALASKPQTKSIIGGGDTADFVLKWDGRGGKSFTHVSTGGGASLDLMAGKKLPGIESLLDVRK